MVGSAVMFLQYGVDDGVRRRCLSLLGLFVTLLAKVVDVETQHVFVIDGVGDGIGVQLFFEDILGGFE